MTDQIYLNGHWLEAKDAKISILDRGLLFADGVYAVIPYVHGSFFRQKDHIDRLNDHLKALNIPGPYPDWAPLFDEALKRNGIEKDQQATIYCQVTRGADPIRAHIPTNQAPLTIFIQVPRHTEAPTSIKAITHPDLRWGRCDIKTTCLLPNTMALAKAKAEGADEAIMHRDGIVTEATHSNVFWIKDDTLYTPALSHWILPGITRKHVLEMAIALDIRYQTPKNPSLEDLQTAESAFLTRSKANIVTLTHLDNTPFPRQDHPIITKLKHYFYQHVPSSDTPS